MLSADQMGFLVELSITPTEQKLRPPAELGEDWYCFLFNSSPNTAHTLSAAWGGTLTGYLPNRAPFLVVAPGDFLLVSSNGASFDIVYYQRRQQGFNRSALYLTSDSFNVSKTSDFRITCVGGAGSGAVAYGATGIVLASGGAAGGVTTTILNLVSAYILSMSVGAGGAGVSRTVAGVTNGNPGGASSVSGTLLALTSTGGSGGNAGLSGSALGAVGGVGSGGSVNYLGGASGVAAAPAVTDVAAATGGGAVPLYSPYSLTLAGPSSGNAGSNTASHLSASGGAGVGGNSGVATDGAGPYAASGGAGSASGTFINGQGLSPDAVGVYGTGGLGNPMVNHSLLLNGSGTAGSATTSATPGAGAGSGGAAGAAAVASGPGGIGAGSGGVASRAAAASGAGGLGAGSGGVAGLLAAGTLSSGKGGDGWVLLEWWED